MCRRALYALLILHKRSITKTNWLSRREENYLEIGKTIKRTVAMVDNKRSCISKECGMQEILILLYFFFEKR